MRYQGKYKKCKRIIIGEKKKLDWLYEKFGGKCFFCGIKTNRNVLDGDDMATLDHLTPSKKGGQATIWNSVLCCKACNSRKGHMDAFRFRKLNYNKHAEDEAARIYINARIESPLSSIADFLK